MRKFSYIPYDWATENSEQTEDLFLGALKNFGLTLYYFKHKEHRGLVLLEDTPRVTDKEYEKIKRKIKRNLKKIKSIIH